MKKVLFIASVVKLHIMVFHIPYLKWFKENGYQVHVAARNDYEDKNHCKIPFCDEFYDIPFERSPFKKNNLYAYSKLKRIIEANNYKIIHCHTPIGGALGRIAAREARKSGTQVVYTAHGFHFFKGAPIKNWLFYYPIERFLARFTDTLITINQEDYERAKKSFKAERVEYVPGVGIDTEKFSNTIIDKAAKRKELGIPKDAFVVLSVGELNKNKNHKTIIKAIAKIDYPGIYYVICGQGKLEGYLRKLANKLGIVERVRVLGFRSDVSEIYKAADIFALPSYREGLSVSLMEAMASGLPIVCSDIRGNNDLIKNDKGGYLVNPKNVNDYAKKFLKLIIINQLRMDMINYNLERINIFSIENILFKIEKTYFA